MAKVYRIRPLEKKSISVIYEMYRDKRRVSVSLATLEFDAMGAGTRLRYREQALILDSDEDAGKREKRTSVLFDQMEASLRVKPAT